VNLVGEGVLQGQMVTPIDQQLVLEVLRRMEVFAGRLLAVATSLNTIVAGRDPAVLHLDIGGRVRELALPVRP